MCYMGLFSHQQGSKLAIVFSKTQEKVVSFGFLKVIKKITNKLPLQFKKANIDR